MEIAAFYAFTSPGNASLNQNKKVRESFVTSTKLYQVSFADLLEYCIVALNEASVY